MTFPCTEEFGCPAIFGVTTIATPASGFVLSEPSEGFETVTTVPLVAATVVVLFSGVGIFSTFESMLTAYCDGAKCGVE